MSELSNVIRKTIMFTECEHRGDLETYTSDLRASGAKILSEDINEDDESAIVLIEVERDYYERFTEHFSDTDSFDFSNLS